MVRLSSGSAAKRASFEHVLTRLGDDDYGVRRIALVAVAEFVEPGDSEASDAILPCFEDEEEEVRAAAAAAIGRIANEGDAGAMKLLVRLFEDDDESVRKAAVINSGKVALSGDEDALRRILKLARSDEDADVRKAAAGALSKFRPQAAKEPEATTSTTGGGYAANATAASTAPLDSAFEATASWQGPRPGMFFGTGVQGTGYYT